MLGIVERLKRRYAGAVRADYVEHAAMDVKEGLAHGVGRHVPTELQCALRPVDLGRSTLLLWHLWLARLVLAVIWLDAIRIVIWVGPYVRVHRHSSPL